MSKASRQKEAMKNIKFGRNKTQFIKWSDDLISCIRHFSGCRSIEELKNNKEYINDPMFKAWCFVGMKSKESVISFSDNGFWEIPAAEMKELYDYLYN